MHLAPITIAFRPSTFISTIIVINVLWMGNLGAELKNQSLQKAIHDKTHSKLDTFYKWTMRDAYLMLFTLLISLINFFNRHCVHVFTKHHRTVIVWWIMLKNYLKNSSFMPNRFLKLKLQINVLNQFSYITAIGSKHA